MTPSSKSLIGRTRELAELEAGLDEATRGTGGLFLLVGEPGIGKTKVADDLARRAKERGFAVHWGRCWEVGGAPAFWPWIQIFRSMVRDGRCKAVVSAYGDVLSRILPELSEAERPSGELDQAQARFQLFDQLWALQRAIAEQTPLLVILDDLHAADPSSLALLRFVARDLRANRVVVVVTYRDREAKPVPEMAETVRAISSEGTFLPLRRLDLEEVRSFLDDRAGQALSTDLAKALHRATEGNPLLVEQVFRMLEARGALGAPPAALPVPEGMRDMIKKRLAALEAPERRVLEAASVVGREFTRPLLAAVCACDEGALRAPLESVAMHGLLVEPVLGVFEFSHGLFREALYRDLAAAERAILHARAAESLEASRAPEKAFAEIATHLLGAVSVVGEKRALEGAMRAGQRALDALAFEDAATILTMALEQLGAPSDLLPLRGRAMVLLGEALARTGAHERARKACDEAAAIARRLDDPTLLADAALALGAEIVPGVVTESLVALLEEASKKLPPEATRSRARVLARLAAALQPAMQPEGPMAFARDAVAMARTLGDETTLRVCLHMGGSALVDYADPGERIEWDGELLRLSTQAGDVIGALRAQARLIFDYLELGRFVDAETYIAMHGKTADEIGIPRYQCLTLMLRSLRALADGRLEEGEALRERARRIGQRGPAVPETGVGYYLQCWGYAIARGEALPYTAEVAEATAHFPGSQVMGLAVSVFEHTRRGELDIARSQIAHIPANSGVLTCAGPHLRFLTDGCARLRDGARAAPIYAALLPIQGRLHSWGRMGFAVEGPTDWLLGMLAGAMDRWDDATRHFEQALRRCVEVGMRPYEALTCLEYARVLSRRGIEAAEKRRELINRGMAIAVELGLPGQRRGFEELAKGGDASSTPVVEAAPRFAKDDASPLFALLKDGELWTCRAGERTFRLKDSRGIAMLAELVEHPGREFHVLSLAGADGADAGDAGEVIDREAAQAYREHVEDLRDQIEEAESFGDRARAEALKRELERVAAELARGVGLGGKSRRAGAAAERARVNVQRRLRDAIRRIGEQDPKVGKHLDRAVRTGTFCAYEPG
jgi:tetratricopeptide (TPR) repeat protein